MLCGRRARPPPQSATFDVEGNVGAAASGYATALSSTVPPAPPIGGKASWEPHVAMAPTLIPTVSSSSAPPLASPFGGQPAAPPLATPFGSQPAAPPLATPFSSAAPFASQPAAPLAAPFASQPVSSPFAGTTATPDSHRTHKVPPTASPAPQAPASHGPCRVERFQAALDPLLEPAMALHIEASGKEGIQKGLHELYHKISAGEFPGAVQEKLVRFVTAVEVRDMSAANQVREQIVRTTTVGWVEGGTWQWCLKHLLEAAKREAPTDAPVVGAPASYADATDADCAPEIVDLMNKLRSRFAQVRSSMDARKSDDIEKKLENLFTSLRNGYVSNNTIDQLCTAIQASENNDAAVVQRCLQDIAKTDFDSSKAWLPALKQMFR